MTGWRLRSYARMAIVSVRIRRVRLFSKNFKWDIPISGEAAFVRRFYLGRCRGTYLLASCHTLMGRVILQERAGRGSRPMAESVADKFRMSAMTNDALEHAAKCSPRRRQWPPKCSGRALRCLTDDCYAPDADRRVARR
jgi:hypothetical protein